jgi:hypothetical protein
MRYLEPLTTIRLDPVTAQKDVDHQRQRFKQLIAELFPLDRVESFIVALLEADTYPGIGTFDLNAGLKWPLQDALTRENEPVQASFDLEAERMGPHGKPRFDASEFRFAVELLRLRPGLALAILLLRRFLVIWAHTLRERADGVGLGGSAGGETLTLLAGRPAVADREAPDAVRVGSPSGGGAPPRPRSSASSSTVRSR